MNTAFHPNHHTGLRHLRFISWLEMAQAGVSLPCLELGKRVIVRLMDLQGSQAWWGVTLDDRWLRGSHGTVTIFDSLPAASRFLQLLKVNRFNIGEHCEHGPLVAGQAHEVYTLGDHCKNCHRATCGAAPGEEIFPCLQLSQRRLSMSHPMAETQHHQAAVPLAA